MLRVGLISDTHGLLRPEARSFLQGCDHIVHGGDIGHPGILDELRALAPLTAVRGNIDKGPWAHRLRDRELLEVGAISLYVIHDLGQLDIEPQPAGVRVVISGHSHKPVLAERGGVLFINPGSAGPRRFKLPIAVGEFIIEGSGISARIVDLADDARHSLAEAVSR
jgi:putative phosphoesterase